MTKQTAPSSKLSLNCPICLDRIRGAFVTKCGHSFCFSCISEHTKGQSTLCPVCRSVLGEGDLFPNYALEELSRSADTVNTQSSTMTHSKPVGSILFIRQRIAELMEQKTKLEKGSQVVESEITLDFLTKLYEKKKKILDDVTVELHQIERDIKHLKAKTEVSSPSFSIPIGSLSEDGNSVPSLNIHESLCPPAKRIQLSDGPELLNFSYNESNGIGQARKLKMDAYFPELENIYFECRKEDNDQLDKFSRKLEQVTGQNIYKEVASFSLPESLGTNNIISSLDFDFTGQMFASGGVSKRIKIFNFDQMESGNWTSNFPNQEIHARSKLSSIAWNPYIQQQLASVDYDGLLNIYDSATGQIVARYEEHDRRAWSVDYSKPDPTRLATGSDDHRIKIWSLNSRGSVCTIDGKANICSVKFSPTSPNVIAFGSADHNVHLYDLRFPTRSTHMLQGHKKAVSYVRFLANDEIVSASTDCSLRMWKVQDSGSDSILLPGSSLDKPECRRVYSGHLNEKNFVGFSVSGDLISCGSESNIVYAYHRDLSRPISSFRFSSVCPRSGVEIETESPGFISALCWRPEHNCLVAANSQGIIKVLEMSA